MDATAWMQPAAARKHKQFIHLPFYFLVRHPDSIHFNPIDDQNIV